MRMVHTATIIIKRLHGKGPGLLKCPATLFSVIV